MSTVAHFSLAEYDRMIGLGVFDQTVRRRLELVRGEIREMTPIGSPHEWAVERLNFWSIRNLPEGRAWVRVQDSIGFPELDSAPEPDIAWVAYRDYSQRRPVATDVLLVVEVADSSLAYDRGEKAALYAEAGNADYWIVNVADRSIEVYRQPSRSAYRSTEVYRGDDELRPLAVPEVIFRPSMLWGPSPLGPPA